MSASKIFKKIFTRKNLIMIFSDHIYGSQAVGIDRIKPSKFQSNLKGNVDDIILRANSGNYNFINYKQKLIQKGANKNPRVISIPSIRDRILLKGLSLFFQQLFPFAIGEIPQIKIEKLKAEIATEKYDSFIKIDLSEFYTSLPQNELLVKLKRKIRKREIIQLIESSIKTLTVPEGKKVKGFNSKGVPQGLAISNILAEIYIFDFDERMKLEEGIFYQRYVDDILILCSKKDVDSLAIKVIGYLKNIKLNPHLFDQPDSKSIKGKIQESFDYLGYAIHYPKISVRKSTILKFESSIAKIFTTYRYHLSKASHPVEMERALRILEWRLNLRLTGCIFEGKRLGWIFYFSQVDTTTPLRAIDSTVFNLAKRFNVDSKIKIKSLVKAFYEGKRKLKESHRYIPNFDIMSVGDKRNILQNFLVNKNLSGFSDEKIESLFKSRIGTVVRELEQDIGHLS